MGTRTRIRRGTIMMGVSSVNVNARLRNGENCQDRPSLLAFPTDLGRYLGEAKADKGRPGGNDSCGPQDAPSHIIRVIHRQINPDIRLRSPRH